MRRWTTIFLISSALCASVALPAASDEAMRIEKDVVFARVDGTRLALDVYAPVAEGPHPAVIALHGGGWHQGDKSRWGSSAQALVEAGFVLFSINYSLATSGDPTFVTAPKDVRRAIGWVRDHGADYGADGSTVSLIGSSAGAHLSFLVGQRVGSPRIDAVVAWSPPLNLKGLAIRGILRGAMSRFLGCSLVECRSRYRNMSPLNGVEKAHPPALIANSTDEIVPFSQVLGMADRLEAFGIDHEVVKVEGEEHGQKLRSAVMDETISFLQLHSSS